MSTTRQTILACFAATAVVALTPFVEAAAQGATPPARATSPAATQAPARAATRNATVITIDRANLTAEPPTIDAVAADTRTTGARLAAPIIPGGTVVGSATARPGMAGTLAAPPPGKLNVTLTPKQPAAENRAYLSYGYPNTVYLSKGDAYVMYSSQNMPGHFGYTAHVKQGSRYLIEIDVRADGGTGNVVHSIGGNQSTHPISNNNAPVSAIIIPSADGWVSGNLFQGNSPAGFWRVRSVKISEID